MAVIRGVESGDRNQSVRLSRLPSFILPRHESTIFFLSRFFLVVHCTIFSRSTGAANTSRNRHPIATPILSAAYSSFLHHAYQTRPRVATIFAAGSAIAAANPPPACLLGAIKYATDSAPALVSQVNKILVLNPILPTSNLSAGNATTVESAIAGGCGTNAPAALSAFVATCSGAGVTVPTTLASGTATGGAATSTSNLGLDLDQVRRLLKLRMGRVAGSTGEIS